MVTRARARSAACARPIFQLRRRNIGGFRLQDSRFRFQPLFNALHFAIGGVASDVEIRNQQRYRNQQEGTGRSLRNKGLRKVIESSIWIGDIG